MKEDAGAGFGVSGRPVIDAESDPRAGMLAGFGQGGRDLVALGRRQEAPPAKGTQESHVSARKPNRHGAKHAKPQRQ